MATLSRSLVLSFLFLGISAVFMACSKDEDENEPTIDFVNINGQASDIAINAGDDFVVLAQFTDDVELGECRVEVYNLFKTNEVLSYLKIYELAGVTATQEWTIEMLDTTSSGPYMLELRLLDAAGNEADTFELNFEILQSTQPVISLTAPNMSQTLTSSASDTIDFAGTVTDDSDIELITVELYDDGSVLNTLTYNYTDSVVTSWDFSQIATDLLYFTIPSTTEVGTYDLEVTASDIDGNYTRQSATVTIQ